MRIGVIGAGRIGGNIAERWSSAGHEVMLSFSRSPERLAAQAASIGARTGTPAEAAGFGEVVLISVMWDLLDDVLAQAGSLADRLVVDTTNQYGSGGPVTFPGGESAAHVNAGRMSGARYAKAFNTLTSAFQRKVGASAGGPVEARPPMFYSCAEDGSAPVMDGLIGDCGFRATRLPWAAAALLEPAQHKGAGTVYNVQYAPADAARIAGTADVDIAAAGRLAAQLHL